MRCVGLRLFSRVLTIWEEAYLEFAHVCDGVGEYIHKGPDCGSYARDNQHPLGEEVNCEEVARRKVEQSTL